MKKIFLLAISFMLLSPTIGFSQSRSINKIEKEISKLTKQMTKQESKITRLTASYNKNFEKSNSLKHEGELSVRLGEQGLLDSLNNYKSLVSQLGHAQNSKELKEEIKSLKQLESSWSGFEKKIRSGEKALEKSIKFSEKAAKENEELSELTEEYQRNKAKISRLEEQKRIFSSGR